MGGTESGGILVRNGPEKTSEALPDKLAFGAVLEEVALSGDRLNYRKVKGYGPEQGWILLVLKGKVLARRIVAPEEDEDEDEDAAAVADEPKTEEPAPQPASGAAIRSEQDKRLHLELEKRAAALQVQLDALENQDPDHLAELLEKLERSQKSTASKLSAQYAQMGYAVDEDDLMERTEMARLVREALIWQELKQLPLADECHKQGLQAERDQPREELLALLANSTWEKLGIPVTRLPSLDAARSVLSQIRSLENASPNKLVAECKQWELPTGASQATLASQLKQAYIWKQLPATELCRECKAHGISPNVGDLSVEPTREKLYEQLVSCIWGNRCEARGIPANRLGSIQLAEELLVEVDRFQAMGLLSLKLEYRKMGITFDSKLDPQALVDRLRDMLIWEHLPLPALQEECRQRGMAAGDGRKAMLQRLRKRLDHELELEAQGLPVRRLGGYEAAMELVEQHEAIEQMSMEELLNWYKGTGSPEEKSLTKEELTELLKVVAVWEALPLSELTQDCAKKNIEVKDVNQVGSDDEQREYLVTKLLQRNRMEMWQERGFQAETIGNFEKASEVVRCYSHFESMRYEDLEKQYASQGLPKGQDVDRAAMLETLKTVLIWEALPLFDLQMDCLERSDKIQCDFEDTASENEQRSNLIQQLVVERLRSAYDQNGVPVDLIGYLDSFRVGKQLASYSIMSQQELQDECSKFALPVTPDMTCAELVSRLRSYTLWDVLPADDLWAECKKRGIQEELREQILGLLLARAWAS